MDYAAHLIRFFLAAMMSSTVLVLGLGKSKSNCGVETFLSSRPNQSNATACHQCQLLQCNISEVEDAESPVETDLKDFTQLGYRNIRREGKRHVTIWWKTNCSRGSPELSPSVEESLCLTSSVELTHSSSRYCHQVAVQCQSAYITKVQLLFPGLNFFDTYHLTVMTKLLAVPKGSPCDHLHSSTGSFRLVDQSKGQTTISDDLKDAEDSGNACGLDEAEQAKMGNVVLTVVLFVLFVVVLIVAATNTLWRSESPGFRLSCRIFNKRNKSTVKMKKFDQSVANDDEEEDYAMLILNSNGGQHNETCKMPSSNQVLLSDSDSDLVYEA